jgi:hypothetical protein
MPRILPLIILALFFLPACAPKLPPEGVKPPAAEELWSEFRNSSGVGPGMHSFRIEMSINFSGPKRRDRILAEVWGNRNYPVRMDLKAGMGRIFSMWREDSQNWQAFYPGENTVYIHEDGQRGAEVLGFPTPFNLLETSRFLSGYYALLTPGKYTRTQKKYPGFKYFFSPDNAIRSLTLDHQGIPVRISGRDWTAEIKDYDRGKNMAMRMDMQLPGGKRAIIRIKEAEFREKYWEDKQLQLRIPPDAETRYLLDSEEIGSNRPGLKETFMFGKREKESICGLSGDAPADSGIRV